MSFLAWLRPGSDQELAAERYAGRESATDRAERRRTEREAKQAAQRRASHHRRGARDAARAGQAWSAAQR